MAADEGILSFPAQVVLRCVRAVVPHGTIKSELQLCFNSPPTDSSTTYPSISRKPYEWKVTGNASSLVSKLNERTLVEQVLVFR